jgi:hypothetical protein
MHSTANREASEMAFVGSNPTVSAKDGVETANRPRELNLALPVGRVAE